MSFIYETPVTLPGTFAGGEASFSDLWSAARDAAIYADNFNASDAAFAEAYDRRNDVIFKATGQRLNNPARAMVAPDLVRKKWQNDLANLQNARPDLAREIRAHVPIEEDAKQIAREAGTRFDTMAGAREDFAGKWAAMIGGGIAGSLRDPLQVATLFAGAGVGSAKNVAGRIFSTAWREAALNGAIEGAMQPQVQAWRREAGLSAGFDEALRNTLVAAGFAGVLGGGGRAVAEIASRMLADVPVPDADQFAKIADAMPPDVRGAIAAAQADEAIAKVRPKTMPQEQYDETVSQAVAATEAGQPIEIKLKKPKPALKRPMNVMEFIAHEGGLRDDAGELAARGLDLRRSMTYYGPAYRKKGIEVAGGGLFGSGAKIEGRGVPPGRMLEKLQQAGYIQRYGDGQDTLTEQHMYDLIDQHLAGESVYSIHDREEVAALKAARDGKLAELEGDDWLINEYGDDAPIAKTHGLDIADAVRAARQDGVAFEPDDLDFARDWMDATQSSAGDALEEALVNRINRNLRAALDESGDLDISDIPPIDGDEFHAQLDEAGRSLSQLGSEDDFAGGARAAPGERGSGGEDGEVAGAAPADTGGISDVTGADSVSFTEKQYAELLKQVEDAELAIGLPLKNTDIAKEIERLEHLQALVSSCKVV